MFPVTRTPDGVWRNWGRTASVTPQLVATPAGVEDVVELVRTAAATGRRVKAVGSGHSFTGIAVADDIQVDLSRLTGLVAVDAERARVTLRAGTPLHAIPGLLAPHGLAMANLGDVDRQTVAGATATGTHGTGSRFGGISTQITRVTLVTGLGELRTVDETEPELLQAVALSLGALGILVEITLQCVPAFAIRATEGPGRLDDVLDAFADNIAAHDHYEFYWFPHTEGVLTKANTRLPADTPSAGPGRLARYVDDELLSNYALAAVCRVASRFPGVAPGVGYLSARLLSARTFTDSSADVFISARRVRFREMEYAIPVEAVPDAVRRVRAMIERRGYRVSFPIEVRAAAADNLMLSTASGRASGYVAVHRYFRDAPDDYFTDVEAIMTDLGGRPHWGKLHTRRAAQLREAYPRFDEFLAVRGRLDPAGVFRNAYLDAVLGQ